MPTLAPTVRLGISLRLEILNAILTAESVTVTLATLAQLAVHVRLAFRQILRRHSAILNATLALTTTRVLPPVKLADLRFPTAALVP